MTTWSEDDYTAALSHITALQLRIDELRDSIPSLVRPLGALAPSPTSDSATDRKKATLAAMKDAARKAATGIEELKREWQAERTGEVLDKGRH